MERYTQFAKYVNGDGILFSLPPSLSLCSTTNIIPILSSLLLSSFFFFLLEHLSCRVPMVPDKEFYIPFTIPLWGVVEADHTHVGSHINLIFHAEDGKLTGVAAYPGILFSFSLYRRSSLFLPLSSLSSQYIVLDSFQYIAPGSIFHIHGPIKYASILSSALPPSLYSLSPLLPLFLFL